MFRNIINNPDFINNRLFNVNNLDDISSHELNDLKRRLKNSTRDNPVLSVCISAWNEEVNILRCLDSLSNSITDVPYEIVVINNNSSDRTQEVLNQLEVRSFLQPIQGCGISRQLAQEKARGKYILLADADCYYPPEWIHVMYKNLIKRGVVAVYSRHSFLGDQHISRWKYYLYEIGKDIIIELRNFKRPYLNAFGMSFGYHRELGLKEGFVTRNIRGEDGRMCFDLMKYGKIQLVRNNKARVWTLNRRLHREEGSLFLAIYKRVLREILRLKSYFKNPEPHDTKTSENSALSIDKYEEAIISKIIKKKK